MAWPGWRISFGYTAYGNDDTEAFTGVDKPDAKQPGKEPFNYCRYTGKRFDPASGGYDMGFRDYQPGINRFTVRDTYNGALADLNLTTNPWTSNRYSMAGGNPITGIEIDGHKYLLGDCVCGSTQNRPNRQCKQSKMQQRKENWSKPTRRNPTTLTYSSCGSQSSRSARCSPAQVWEAATGRHR